MAEKVEYNSLNRYLRKRFGCKVYKVALSGGFSCPNRDGKIATQGCIFCSEGGSGEFAGNKTCSVSEQLKAGKALIAQKLPDEEVKYIAYFQSFTNTYGPTDELRKKYYEAVSDDEVVALSIATRPDCLPDEVIYLLREINRIKPVFVELGLQTSNEKSAEYINRGYPLDVYDRAVSTLTDNGIEVVTHVILGLPGETKEDMLNTVSHVVKSGSSGIKLQLLHVLKNTRLCKEYEDGKFDVLSLEEYLDILAECLKIIPKEMVVHRLTGDGDKKLLVAPLWSADKKHVLNEINKRAVPI